jgi:hypothetical protein
MNDDEAQDSTERELVGLMSRLIRAAADVRGHSPSRAQAHGNCGHCAATRQATAFVRAMQSDDDAPVEESRIIRP